MSRIGRKPVNIPAGVTVNVDNGVVTVKGPKGELTQKIHPNITVSVDGAVVTPSRSYPFTHCQHGRGCYKRLQERA